MTDAPDAPSLTSPKPAKLPFFTNHTSPAWTLNQIQQAFTEIVYCSFDYVPGKGKKDDAKKTKITILNAHIINGTLFFFEKAAELISSNSPAFVDVNKTISGPTLRAMWEKKVEYRIKQRISWGKGPNAFVETGSGDFPNLQGFSNLGADAAFEKSWICAQIDDALDTHLKNLSAQEQRQREGNGDRTAAASSALSGHESQALVIFQQAPAQHAFGKPMMPAANEGEVANASLKRRGDQSGTATTKRLSSKDGYVEKSLQFGSSVTSLGEKMVAAIQPASLEVLAARSQATASAYAGVFKEAVVEGIKEWRSAPAKSSQLLAMTTSDVITKIKGIGIMFSANTTFEGQMLACGMNGATMSCMSDADLKDFFEKQCSFQAFQASILVASIKSWQLQH
jgi:hypothetical protein